MAGDFEGTEVICPACNECLKLPGKPQEAPPLVEPPQAPASNPDLLQPTMQDEEPDENSAAQLREMAASRDGRVKLLLALLIPLAVFVTALLLLPGKKSAPADATPALVQDDQPVTAPEPLPLDEPSATVPQELAAETAEVLEPIVETPTAPPAESSPTSPTTAPELAQAPADPVETPPALPEPVVMPDPEDGLVEAIPDTPANRRAAAAEAALAAETTPPEPNDVPSEPAAPAQAAAPEEPAAPPASEETAESAPVHKVARGDTLTKIARSYQVEVSAIQRANQLKRDIIHVGQQLQIPGGTPPAVQAAEPTSAAEPSAPTAAVRHHKVVRGDTLSRISRKYGVPQDAIMRANGMKNDIVRLGAELVIPASED